MEGHKSESIVKSFCQISDADGKGPQQGQQASSTGAITQWARNEDGNGNSGLELWSGNGNGNGQGHNLKSNKVSTHVRLRGQKNENG